MAHSSRSRKPTGRTRSTRGPPSIRSPCWGNGVPDVRRGWWSGYVPLHCHDPLPTIPALPRHAVSRIPLCNCLYAKVSVKGANVPAQYERRYRCRVPRAYQQLVSNLPLPHGTALDVCSFCTNDVLYSMGCGRPFLNAACLQSCIRKEEP